MLRLGGNEIRTRFLEYFRERGHEVVPSSPVVPAGDPTLLFTNAGMNQFKDVFLGNEKRPYRRATTSQKCVRAGGKHNDLEEVGWTARHQVFFEMLGNFSFGDYFKSDAIRFAWDLLTREFGLPADRLTATVYKTDDEAFDIWREKIGLPAERVLRLGEKDNFWSMGDVGPCGPCSEIHFDRGAEFACGPECGVGKCECDRWLEVWNLVFMQYDRDSTGKMTPLPRPCVDTGMGLERISSVLQQVPSNYETDLFKPYIDWVSARTGRPYDRGPAGFPFRVLADHARSITFIIADGVLPSNEGRGYVLRRILRRAARFGRVLGFDKPFLGEMVPLVVEVMGEAFPELRSKQSHVQTVIETEETRFLETLAAGTARAGVLLEAAKEKGAAKGAKGVLSGDEAFLLYDTFGFPIDLTEDMATERGLAVDRAGFERAMAEQRRRAREARDAAGAADEVPVLTELLGGQPSNRFVGYEHQEVQTPVLAMVAAHAPGTPGTRPEGNAMAGATNGGSGLRVVDAVTQSDGAAYFLLRDVPFYAESGGQVSDHGTLAGKGGVAEVLRSLRLPDGKILVVAEVAEGRLETGQEVMAKVDADRRRATARNHTATHLLHRALRDVLGEHAAQAGSLVTPERLRFDFSHFGPMTSAEILDVEDRVNRAVLEGRPVTTDVLPYREAVASGAIALFGEKYGSEVRVVSIEGLSRELCGGTHASQTGEIGLLRVVGESGIGSGLRRVEAVTGRGALERFRQAEAALAETAAALKCDPGEVPEKVGRLVAEFRAEVRERERQASKEAQSSASTTAEAAEIVGQARLAVDALPAMSMESLRQAADHVRDKLLAVAGRAGGAEGAGVVVLLGAPTEEGDRVSFVAMVSKPLSDKGIHAGKVIGEVARVAGGGGGGRPDMAQAGGREPAKLREALEKGRGLFRGALEEMAREGKNTPA